MRHPSIRRPIARSILGLLPALLLAAGCITADGTLQQDGSASLTVTFGTTATAEDDKAARALVTAPDVTIESLTIADAAPGERGPRKATAKLATKRVAALDTLPLFRVVGTTIVHEPKADGGGSFKLEVRNATPKKKDDPDVATMNKYQALVRVRVPGPIVETSGTQKDGAVEWTFPAGDWTAGKQLALTITYGPPPAAGPEGTPSS